MMSFFRKSPDFFLLWMAQILSQSGTRMYQMALTWWILTRTSGSSQTLAMFLLVCTLPSLLLVQPIGKWIDTHTSRFALVSSDLMAAFSTIVVALLFAFDRLDLTVLYISTFFISLGQAVVDPTLNKAIVELVEEEDVEPAVAFVSSTQSIANFGGAILGALLIDMIGILAIVVLNAASYLISSLCAFLIKYRYARRNEPTDDSASAKASWSILKGRTLLTLVLIGFGLINFFGVPTLIVLPLYVKNVLQGSATMLGALEASLWLGLIFGAFFAKFIKKPQNTLLIGAICLLLFGGSFFIVGLVVSQLLYFVALFVAGTVLGVNNVKFLTLFQKIIEDSQKGRFFALMQALISFTFPLGYFLFGFLGTFMIPTTLCLIQGAGIMILSLGFYLLAPRYQELREVP